MERSIEAFVSRELVKVFGKDKLVATDEALPGQIRVDFHFKDKSGDDVFVEVSRKIGRNTLSKILNLYSALSNVEQPLNKFKLIVVGEEIEASAKKALKGLPIQLVTLNELGITQAVESLREVENQLQDRRLSPEEAKLVAMWEAEKKSTIRARDVIDSLHCTADYAYVLLHKLERKHWLERVSSGLYQFIPASYYGYPEKIPPANALMVGAAFVEPYYFSYYTANSHYGFTTQMPFTLFIATPKKKPKVEWQSVAFQFVTLPKRKFFGYRIERAFDAEVCMAEPEKAIVDSFDKPSYAGGVEQLARITWRGLARVDKAKLVNYALKMGSHSLVQRLGFIIDSLSKEDLIQPLPADLKSKLLKSVGNAPIYLDSKRAKKGSFSKDWRVIDNVPKDQLLSEIEVR